jgi:transposase-like protein
VIGAGRYERKVGRRDRRNGTYPRDLVTSVGVIEELAVPRTRKGHQTRVFARYHRRQDELDQAIGAMFVAGASQKQVGNVMEGLTGQQPSPATVSRVHHTLAAEFEQWKQRPLQAHYRYLFADGTYSCQFAHVTAPALRADEPYCILAPGCDFGACNVERCKPVLVQTLLPHVIIEGLDE